MSEPTTIYLVQGSTGEYSDHTEWIVAAYRDQAEAQNLVVKLQALAATFSYYDRDYETEEKAMREAGDPHFHMDYTGTKYSLFEVELR